MANDGAEPPRVRLPGLDLINQDELNPPLTTQPAQRPKPPGSTQIFAELEEWVGESKKEKNLPLRPAQQSAAHPVRQKGRQSAQPSARQSGRQHGERSTQQRVRQSVQQQAARSTVPTPAVATQSQSWRQEPNANPAQQEYWQSVWHQYNSMLAENQIAQSWQQQGQHNLPRDAGYPQYGIPAANWAPVGLTDMGANMSPLNSNVSPSNPLYGYAPSSGLAVHTPAFQTASTNSNATRDNQSPANLRRSTRLAVSQQTPPHSRQQTPQALKTLPKAAKSPYFHPYPYPYPSPHKPSYHRRYKMEKSGDDIPPPPTTPPPDSPTPPPPPSPPAPDHPTAPSPSPMLPAAITGQQHAPIPGAPVRVAPKPSAAYLKATDQNSPLQTKDRPLLVILDLNGTLCFRTKSRKLNAETGRQERTHKLRADLKPFLHYLVRNHHVMVWTSMRPENMEPVLKDIFQEFPDKLVAEWDRTSLRLNAKEYNDKVQVYKQLTWVWSGVQCPSQDAFHPLEHITFDQTNTVLIDDSLEKCVSEPHNHILVPDWDGKQESYANGSVLSQVAGYLEHLRGTRNVSAAIKLNRFELDKQWSCDLSGYAAS